MRGRVDKGCDPWLTPPTETGDLSDGVRAAPSPDAAEGLSREEMMLLRA